VSADEVPSYLSAADVGLSFIKPCFSKLASSPTKNGEYLACGLPLILNAGIGDSDSLVSDWKAGALLEEFSDEAYDDVSREVEAILSDSEIRTKMRNVARAVFDLETVAGERYAALYERVLN
jgi:glycosyltransferase involved in cell wall biosynthesis